MTDNVIPFPPRLRLVAPGVPAFRIEDGSPVLVDHGGRLYRVADLLARLSVPKLAEVEAGMPRSGQAAWDEVVRRWPALADEIAASCRPATYSGGLHHPP